MNQVLMELELLG